MQLQSLHPNHSIIASGALYIISHRILPVLLNITLPVQVAQYLRDVASNSVNISDHTLRRRWLPVPLVVECLLTTQKCLITSSGREWYPPLVREWEQNSSSLCGFLVFSPFHYLQARILSVSSVHIATRDFQLSVYFENTWDIMVGYFVHRPIYIAHFLRTTSENESEGSQQNALSP